MESHEYFLNIAKSVAMKSKDNSSKVGSVIVDPDNRIVSTGYNGMIAGADEKELTYERPMKYFTIIHAEANALLFARRDLRGCKIYITHSPCENCLKHILQSGIRELYYGCPSIIRDRGTSDQKEALTRLIKATDARVININNGNDYIKDLGL